MYITDGAPEWRNFSAQPSFLLTAVARVLERNWKKALKKCGMTQAEFLALAVLEPNEQLDQKEISFRLGIDPRNMVATIASLKERGLINEKANPFDKRSKQIQISKSGTDLMTDLEQRVASLREDHFKMLTTEEYLQLQQILQKVYSTLMPQS
ncbi:MULTISPECIES: MarR family winged helix-turn-helix transcriptional regulator [Corynebacterium]|uniref:MarR family winged helix-turn-helix transcriptional regulator n=1 Tax=Corynebacterium TaxID=1716 RepID=UPI001EF3416F|nr:MULTISPECIES: MarR family transcriptional regulator [Corynebacterium]MCG7441426.1 MarR family transcriptional regulator [Corynebacterium sp. ACRPQ]